MNHKNEMARSMSDDKRQTCTFHSYCVHNLMVGWHVKCRMNALTNNEWSIIYMVSDG